MIPASLQWGRLTQRKKGERSEWQPRYRERQKRQRKRHNTWGRGGIKMLIASHHASSYFSRKLAGVQIICN